ncbi:hypothetical protein AABM38_10115 [Heyndrickxia sp. MSNUG]|uniref:hypothetical protein n=1 Tax=Heyndrickxia sp. MSNUG TaxID=3136677 RepID=UPI003C2D66C8
MDYKQEYERLLAENEKLKESATKKNEENENLGRETYLRLKQKGKIRGGKL